MNIFGIKLPSAKADASGDLKNFLVKKIIKKYPWLTVAGIDEPYGSIYESIDFAGPGDVITFGTSKTHDVSWVAKEVISPKYHTNIFDLGYEFDKAMTAFEKFAKENKEQDNIDGYFFGKPYKVYDDFIQIGRKIYPKRGFNPFDVPKQDLVTIETMILDIYTIIG